MNQAAKKQQETERRLVGRRIRRRRLILNMTQGALARALGVSFQMIQKYENGATRVPGRRLDELCHHLDVSPAYFSQSQAVAGPEAEALEHFLQSPDGIALYRAIATLPDPALRGRLVMAVCAFCDSHLTPEDDLTNEGGTALLTHWIKQITASGEQQKETAEAAIRAMKVEVARLLGGTLKARALTQAFAAHVLKTDQARISALARGQVEGSSLEKLLRFLLLLGWDAELKLVRRAMGHNGKLELRLPSKDA